MTTKIETLSKAEIEITTLSDYQFATELTERAADFKPTTQEHADKLSELLVEVKTRFKAMETERKSVTGPMLKAKRDIDGWFKPAGDALNKAEKLLKGKLSAYLAEAEAEKDRALEAGEGAEACATTGKGVSAKPKWVWEVTDISKVPKKYTTLVVDQGAVDAAVAGSNGQASIPGIEIRQEFGITARSRK